MDALHAGRALGQDQIGAERTQHFAPLHRHGLGHDERDGIAARGRHEGQRDSGVAAGGLDQFLARPEDAALLGIPDHGSADAVLHRVGGIPAFDLGQDGGVRAIGVRG